LSYEKKLTTKSFEEPLLEIYDEEDDINWNLLEIMDEDEENTTDKDITNNESTNKE
jgi:hypothetical protein